MGVGWIRDYSENTTAEERRDFRTDFFITKTGAGTHGDLAWGDEVEIDTAADDGAGRVPVTDAAGQAGFVTRSHVVPIRYVDRYLHKGAFRYDVPLYRSETSTKRVCSLLWGDTAQVLRVGDDRTRIRCRRKYGWIDNDHLADDALLELYFIDVGQGDGVLVRTPDGRHLLVDGGYPRLRQPTRRSVADFIDWKWFDDYGDFRVRLDDMIASHADLDHYGGLDDLLNTGAKARAEMDTLGTDLGAFHHPGVSWWKPTAAEITQFDLKGDRKDRWLGPSQNGRLVRLLGDHADASAAVDPPPPPAAPPPQLQGMWKSFVTRAVAATATIGRLGVRDTDTHTAVFLPGYADTDQVPCAIRVLGPVTHRVGGAGPAGVDTVVDFDAESQNTNGHSVVLRLDYGHCRVLLTGDLNKNSMQALAAAYVGEMREFACDVAKACHHGSEDVSYSFLEKMQPAATIISSGDAEGHAHPRAAIVAASGLTGFKEIDAVNDEIVTPLVYSTEVERSVRLGRTDRVETDGFPHASGALAFNLFAQPASGISDAVLKAEAQSHEAAGTSSEVHYREAKPSAFRPKRGRRDFDGSFVVAGVVYGLVNVRTNGDQVMCATMKESGDGWTVRTFQARH